MKVREQISWVVLVTGLGLLIGSTVFMWQGLKSLPTSNTDTSSVSMSRSAIWQRRLEAVKNHEAGQSTQYELTVKGSNPTGTN